LREQRFIHNLTGGGGRLYSQIDGTASDQERPLPLDLESDRDSFPREFGPVGPPLRQALEFEGDDWQLEVRGLEGVGV